MSVLLPQIQLLTLRASILLLLLLTFSAFAQDQNQADEFKELAGQLSPASSILDIKKLATKAEDIYKDKKRRAGHKNELARITLDFARFRKNIFKVLTEKRSLRNITKEEAIGWIKLFDENVKEMRHLLENSIEIYEKVLKTESEQMAEAKFEFAWLMENYSEPTGRRHSWKDKLEKLNRIQNLYLQALRLREKYLSENDDSILVTAFYVANSYSQTADFENALPYFERFIAGIEEKYGEKSEALVPALQMTAAIWKMLGRDDAAAKAAARISEITGKHENLNEAFLNLTPRARSFKYEGINEKIGRVVFENSIRTLGDGIEVRSPNSLSETSTRENSMRNNPAYIAAIPVLTKVEHPGIITVAVEINENGDVIDANSETGDPEIKAKVEKAVRMWQFEPLILDGQPRRIKGFVIYYN